MKILIINPTSTEVIRPSYCYFPYMLYSFYKTHWHQVTIKERFTFEEIEETDWDNWDRIIVGLWSYPQIDLCNAINRFVKKKIKFVGYSGLIKREGLREYYMTERNIIEGSEAMFYMFEDFEDALLSDCDMHVKEYEGQVYPMFASYGCPRGCKFCPASKNCKRKIFWVDLEAIEKMLLFAIEKDRMNIHFTDEDFFINTERTKHILYIAYQKAKKQNKKFNFVALATAGSLEKYLKEYGHDKYIDQVKVIEIGYESADPKMLEGMNKIVKTDYVLKEFKNHIFWLTLTFFPGETIESLRKTGDWMRDNGTKSEDLLERVKGNSTVGGLGQFFQPYPDTISILELRGQGEILSERPIRLIPSFVPYSFSNQIVEWCRKPIEKEYFWFDYYNVPVPPLKIGLPINLLIRDNRYQNKIDGYISYAIAAKLGVIK